MDAVEIDPYAIKSFNAIHNTNFEAQDITKYNKHFDDIDIITHGSPCFVAGTKVLTSTGYKNIEDIQVNDMVLTHKNRFCRVLNIGNKQSDDVYLLKSQGMVGTFVTGNHPYYVKSRIKKWNNSKRAYENFFSDAYWKPVNELRSGDFLGVPIPTVETNPYNFSELDCWLLGRYVADGHLNHHKRKGRINSFTYEIIFSIGKDKVEHFKNMVGTHYNISVYPHSQSTYRGRWCSKYMTNIILDLGFGRGALNKTVPNDILNLPINLAKSFLDGYMSGDGWCSGNNCRASTVSEDLVLKLQLLISKVYDTSSNIYKSLKPSTTYIENRLVNQHDVYEIKFHTNPCSYTYTDLENNIIWYPFKKLQKMDSNYTVYNLTVDTDNSYTANNFIVHNCQDFSIAGLQAGGDEGSNTRSSLMYETLRIVKDIKPKYILWENVKNVLSEQHIHNFDKYITLLENLGYFSYYQVLNAKDFGIPQNRERIYVISVRNDITDWFFFPSKEPLEKSIKDFLDVDVPQKYYLSPRMLNYCMDDKEDTNYPRRERFLSNINRKNQNIANTISTNAGNRPVDNFIKMKNGKVTFEQYPVAFRGRYDENGNLYQNMEINKDGVFNTLTTFTKDNCLLSNEDGEIKIRKLTPCECWKLMGFTSDDFDKASKVNSDTQLYKQAGNSIVVSVLEKIFKNLLGGK